MDIGFQHLAIRADKLPRRLGRQQERRLIYQIQSGHSVGYAKGSNKAVDFPLL
jgi:hypothetical protein